MTVYRETVCVDFDGVLNDYAGWRGAEEFGLPREGAREFIAALRERYTVVVLTTRDPDAVAAWLRQYRILADDVTDRKRPARVYVDDRGMRFNGSFDGLIECIAAFRTHWEKPAGG